MTQTSDRLKDKVAIVTGAGTSGAAVGTGQAMSILFARQGAKVLLADFSQTNADKTHTAIEAEGGESSIFQGDLTSAADCERMTNTAMERYGSIDILVNNIGGGDTEGKVPDIGEEQWDSVLDMNLKTVMLTGKYAIPAMIATGGGAIINISSVDGIRAGVWPNIPYAAAKGGVVTMTTHMAVHHGRDNVRVNCIAPGMIYTSQMIATLEAEQGMRQRRQFGAPLGTEGTAWDIAWAAVFLASDEARWITGVTIPVDAGLLASTPLSMRDLMK